MKIQGTLLKNLRENNHFRRVITQRELGEFLQLKKPEQRISNWECEREPVPKKYTLKICEFFQIDSNMLPTNNSMISTVEKSVLGVLIALLRKAQAGKLNVNETIDHVIKTAELLFEE